jgi:uncharacterized protein (DUF2252 family)
MRSPSWRLLALVALAAGCNVVAPGQGTTSSSVDSGAARKAFLKSELESANAALDPAAREEKYSAMEASAFAFFRATDHLYFTDIENGVIAFPAGWASTAEIRTWIQGDLHPQNVGYFGTKDGVVVLDLNDFDESYPAPFYYDLVRFVAGVHLMRSDVSFHFSRSEAEDVSLDSFLTEYQSTLAAVNGNSTETTVVLSSGNLSGFTRDKADDLASSTNAELLDKYTVEVGGARTFDLANPDLAAMTPSDAAEISSGYPGYTASLGSFYGSKPASYWSIKSQAVRLHSGLGSLGRTKYYLLLEGPTSGQDDDILLEVKESLYPTMLTSAESDQLATYDAQFASHGHRASTANKAMLNKADDHLGYMDTAARSYVVHRVSPYKFGFDAEDFTSQTDLANFVKYCARATAYAHSRADKDHDTTYVSYNFENGALDAIAAWPHAKTTMASLGETYSDQVLADYGLFLELRAAGDL